uniref:Uncharacterized protein n=1 Tax=mine drainage metagenome TaxID=410659 RepID=E6PNJ6_9ZZZZ
MRLCTRDSMHDNCCYHSSDFFSVSPGCESWGSWKARKTGPAGAAMRPGTPPPGFALPGLRPEDGTFQGLTLMKSYEIFPMKFFIGSRGAAKKKPARGGLG